MYLNLPSIINLGKKGGKFAKNEKYVTLKKDIVISEGVGAQSRA